MKSFSAAIIIFLMVNSFMGCSHPPEKYFDAAVLNTNYIAGFADKRLAYELASPHSKLDEKTGGAVPMKRKEIIDAKIDFSEKSLDEIKGLSGNADANAILKNSRLLYEFILPIYKKDYQELAGLYDSAAPEETINRKLEDIHDKYYQTFHQLYENLMANGQVYASKYNIQVNWAK